MSNVLTAIQRLSTLLGADDAANLAASALIEADALGLARFGIAMLDEWAAENAAPLSMDQDPQPISWRDCSTRFAPLAVAGATIDVGKAAQEFGIAVMFLRGVRGFGRLAPFVRHLADAGLVGLIGAEGPPFVAPHGGTRPVIGTNPLAFAMGKGSDRVIIDIASSTTTMADIRKNRAEDRPLPGGIALDHMGLPTRIADEVAALLPRGGQIGSLLGLIVELMAGVAGGGRGDPKGRGVFVLAFDPAAAGNGVDWQSRLADLQHDWITGGGHWPRGGGVSPDTTLDDDFTQRLDAYIARIEAQKRR